LVKRQQNLDSLVGYNGLIIDDVLVDRVTVNWIDAPHDDHIEIEIQYPDLLFVEKTELVIIKSDSGWCWPMPRKLVENKSCGESLFLRKLLWASLPNKRQKLRDR